MRSCAGWCVCVVCVGYGHGMGKRWKMFVAFFNRAQFARVNLPLHIFTHRLSSAPYSNMVRLANTIRIASTTTDYDIWPVSDVVLCVNVTYYFYLMLMLLLMVLAILLMLMTVTMLMMSLQIFVLKLQCFL